MSKPKIIVYDNGGKTLDRYTVCVPAENPGLYDVYTMSKNAYSPQGVNQFAGTMTREEAGQEAGIRLQHVPEAVMNGLVARGVLPEEDGSYEEDS